MLDLCMLCGQKEISKSYKPSSKVNFVCSKCIQLLLTKTQEEITKNYKLAIEKGYEFKARVLRIFIRK